MAVIISLSSWGQQQWAHSVTQPPTYLATYRMRPLEGLGVLAPHVEQMHTFLEMLSAPMQDILLCSTFSCVRVMDGFLTDSSDANIGLSACAGFGPCKLNLSAPPPLINSLTLDCMCRLAGWFPLRRNYILFILLAEQVGVKFALTFRTNPSSVSLTRYRPF